MISDKRAIQDVVQLLKAKGVYHVIITPGSRNAPFSISFFNNTDFDVHSVVDERSAAFIALGLAQQSDRPVAIICTSGTAALNYAPAIAEAFYQEIPLIIITADRPMEWVDQGEGQTINQSGVFKNFVRASYDIIQDLNDKDFEWYNARVMNEAIDKAMFPVRGPIHLNFPLRESLYKVVDQPKAEVKIIDQIQPSIGLESSVVKDLASEITSKKKVMILVGQFHTEQTTLQLLEQWSYLPNVIIFTESHSGLESDRFVGCIDRMIMTLTEEQLEFVRPELVITIGKNIISRKIKALLRHDSVQHWYVGEDALLMDTFQRLVKIVPVSAEHFFQSLLDPNNAIKSDYSETILSWNRIKQKLALDFAEGCAFSDLSVCNDVLKAIPENSRVQMGNSSIARYIQLFDRKASLKFSGNRGVSGIDGCTSTAVGAAYVYEGITTLITGDLSFLYDSNAFWNELVVNRLKIVVINNGGGGIFRIIEGPPSTPALEKFFETTHQRDGSFIANAFGVNYLKAHNKDELAKGLKDLYNSPECFVLEVFTPRLENDGVLKDFFNYLKNKR